LNSVGPSGGLASGIGICAAAIVTTSTAAQRPNPIAAVARTPVMYITVGVSEV
jgi:hypothetical protein